jgi:clan AA aspartic protease
MGITHAQVTLENPFKRQRIETRALVDSGCLQLTIPDPVARQLGFDPAEFGTLNMRLADGSERNVPRVGPIRIHYAGRWADLTALVFGDEALMGALALEALDLSLNPTTQSITLNLTSPALGFRAAEG